MRYIIDFLFLFWMSVGVVWWLIVNTDANPLSYGVMELVLLALMTGWVDFAVWTRQIWKEELE